MIILPIPGFPDYFAGDDGNIYSEKSKKRRCLKAALYTSKRYLFVVLCRNGGVFNASVHRLVCLAFHGKPKDKMVASHLDGNSFNNKPGNLKWETQKENVQRRFKHGTDDRGVNNSRALFNTEQIAVIRTRIARGDVLRRIAEDMGCTDREIGKIKRGERYKV